MMSPSRVLVLYNEPILSSDHPDAESEREVLINVEAVHGVLQEAGFQVSRLGVNRGPEELLAGLRHHQPDVVFNLFEGTDYTITETYVVGMLDWMDIPFTGCPFQTLVLARSKHLTKHLLQNEGLPTAPYFVAEEGPVAACPLRFPVILKPAQQDSSVGVDQRSVVTDLDALNRQLTYLLRQFGPPVLVEEFIAGREITIALVEMPDLRVLPFTEAVFPDYGPDYWPILSYDAKWTATSNEYDSTHYHWGSEVSPALRQRLETCASRAFRLLGCRDYARVDFRVRPTEEPFILEVNPNPSFGPNMALSNNLTAAGLSHAEFTVQLVRNALSRPQRVLAPRYQQDPLRPRVTA
jgi:D-alanine-D-alanine ligase